MAESHLERVLRLAATSVRSYQRRTSRGRVATVHQYQQTRVTGMGHPQQGSAVAGMRFGTPYRLKWSSVQVGDVLEFGNELWRVIPVTQYPGYKPPTKSSGSKSKGTGKSTGGSSAGTGGAKGTKGGGSGSASSTGTLHTANTYTNYLQNVHKPSQYDKLTLPATFVATVVPVLP